MGEALSIRLMTRSLAMAVLLATVPAGAAASHGSTNVVYPEFHMDLRVDPNGRITGTGSKVYVDHSEPGMFCTKVKDVQLTYYVRGGLTHHSVNKEFGGDGLCNFNKSDCTFEVPIPVARPGPEATLLASRIKDFCASAPSETPLRWMHPLAETANVILTYRSAWDAIPDFLPQQLVAVYLTCARCPTPTLVAPDRDVTPPQRTLTLTAGVMQRLALVDGGGAPVNVILSGRVPPGMTVDRAGVLTGSPATGGAYYESDVMLSAVGVCASGREQSANLIVSIRVRPLPLLTAAEATPKMLPQAGGSVTLRARVTGRGGGVVSVRALLSRGALPGGRGAAPTAVTLKLASGTSENGVWEAAFVAPRNAGNLPEPYAVAFELANNYDHARVDGKTGAEFVVSGSAPLGARK